MNVLPTCAPQVCSVFRSQKRASDTPESPRMVSSSNVGAGN